jgi:simple sugar transport system substrate-binding protein
MIRRFAMLAATAALALGIGSAAMAQDKARIVAVSMDPTAIQSAVKTQFAANADIEGVLTLGPSAAEPTLQALEELDLVGKVKLGTFDLSPGVLQAVRDGKMVFAIDQQQYLQGYLSVAFLTLHKKYGLMPAGTVMTGPGFVTKDTAAQVIDLSAKGIR